MEIQAIAGVSRLFFVIAVWKSLCFPKHLRYCVMNALPLPYSSPSAAVCCRCAVLLLCVRFLKGPHWRNHHHPWLLRPPYSHVVSGCYFPILTCMQCFGPFRSLFSALKYKEKRSAALLSGAYRLVQGYRPSFLQSLINVTPFILREIYPAFLQVFILPLPNEPFTIKKKNAPYILVPVYFCISHVSSEKKTKKNR